MAEIKKEKSAEELKAEYEAKQKGYLNDIKTYAYGGVAGNALAQKNVKKAGVSLDMLVKDMFGEDKRLEGLLAGVRSSDEAITTAASVYADKYQSAIGSLTVSNLWNFYEEYSNKYMPEEIKSNAAKEIEKFKGVEFGKILKGYTQAQKIVSDEDDLFTKEQKEKAQKDIEKYQKVAVTLSVLGNAYLGKYETGVTDESMRQTFKQMYGEKPKE